MHAYYLLCVVNVINYTNCSMHAVLVVHLTTY